MMMMMMMMMMMTDYGRCSIDDGNVRRKKETESCWQHIFGKNVTGTSGKQLEMSFGTLCAQNQFFISFDEPKIRLKYLLIITEQLQSCRYRKQSHPKPATEKYAFAPIFVQIKVHTCGPKKLLAEMNRTMFSVLCQSDILVLFCMVRGSTKSHCSILLVRALRMIMHHESVTLTSFHYQCFHFFSVNDGIRSVVLLGFAIAGKRLIIPNTAKY